eukprot:CAMPEP_0180161648 /NCGR_PEP_ID=MMETSP0986-20121125/28783_1 /TAXON_ID=697907 /ORGANISM="non described non described, Strain CCMP2293" /LENGTH=218 /DNA_ID=CAMNT_0022112041 /DNA_START=443 /DNA_END=1097 /DNA_ORIENTATION=+
MDGVNLKPGWMSGGSDGRQRGSNFGAQASGLNDLYQGDLLGGFSGNSVAVETPASNAFQGTRTTPSSQLQPPRRSETYASETAQITPPATRAIPTEAAPPLPAPAPAIQVSGAALSAQAAPTWWRAQPWRPGKPAWRQSRAGLLGATAGGGLLSRTGAPAVLTPGAGFSPGGVGGWGKSAAPPQPPAPTPPSTTAAPALKLPPAFSLQYVNKTAAVGR